MLTWEKSLGLLGLVYLLLWGRQRAQQCEQWSVGYLCGGREREARLAYSTHILSFGY